MSGRQPARQHPLAHIEPTSDTPRAGLYQVRLVKGGMPVAVKLWCGPPHDPWTGEELDRSWRWQALRNGVRVETWEVWPRCVAEPIDQETYDWLLADRAWAAEHAPHLPESSPAEPVNFSRLPADALF